MSAAPAFAAPAFAAPAFLRRLRAETAAAHQAIERIPAFARLTAPGLDHADLAALLNRTHAFHAALHAPLAAALAAIPAAAEFHDATRLDALLQDLAFFGLHPNDLVVMDAPPLPSAAHALGYLYVIEGSSLGGRVIARRLEDHLGLTASSGARFFTGRDAAATRLRFQRLAALLEHEAASPEAADAIIGGANAAFTAFAAWMTGPAHSGTAHPGTAAIAA